MRVSILAAVFCLFAVQGTIAAPAKTLPTRQEWQKRGGISATWPPARMSDDELQIWADMLIEEGHSYGEYLSLRLQARHARDAFSAVALVARAEQIFQQHWKEWVGDLPVDTIETSNPDKRILRDRRGLVRGLSISVEGLRQFVATDGQQRYENKGFDWLILQGSPFGPHRALDADIALIAEWQLTGLSLFYSKVMDAGATMLAANKTLKYIDLSHSRVRDPGVIALLKSKSIEALELGGNSLSDAVLVELGSNHVVKRIDLRSNMLTDAGLKELQKNKTLSDLILGENNYTAAGVEQLLRTNRALKYVGLSERNARADCQRLLTQANPTVTDSPDLETSWWPE